VGIAGMQMFDGNLGTPQFVDHRLVWMTPEWKAAFRHAGPEADLMVHRASKEVGLDVGGPSPGFKDRQGNQPIRASANTNLNRKDLPQSKLVASWVMSCPLAP
jgi:hypothetical protein